VDAFDVAVLRAPVGLVDLTVDAISGALLQDVQDAYDAPFADPTYEAGLRQMISLIPLTRNDPGTRRRPRGGFRVQAARVG
jgi:hypothetical protein